MFKKKGIKKGKEKAKFIFESCEEEGEDDPFSMGEVTTSGGPKKRKMKQSSISAFGIGRSMEVNIDEAPADMPSSAQRDRNYGTEELAALKSNQTERPAEEILSSGEGARGMDLGITLAGDEADWAEVNGVQSGVAAEEAKEGPSSKSASASASSAETLARRNKPSGTGDIPEMLELLSISINETEEAALAERRRVESMAFQAKQLADERVDRATKTRVAQAKERMLTDLHAFTKSAMAAIGGAEQRIHKLAAAAQDTRGRTTRAARHATRLSTEARYLSRYTGPGAAQAPPPPPPQYTWSSVWEQEARAEGLVWPPSALSDYTKVASRVLSKAHEAVVHSRDTENDALAQLERASALLLKSADDDSVGNAEQAGPPYSITAICQRFQTLRESFGALYAGAYIDDCLEIALAPLVMHHLALSDPFTMDNVMDASSLHCGRVLGDAASLSAVQALSRVSASDAKGEVKIDGSTVGNDDEDMQNIDTGTSLLHGLVRDTVLPWLGRCVHEWLDPQSEAKCRGLRNFLRAAWAVAPTEAALDENVVNQICSTFKTHHQALELGLHMGDDVSRSAARQMVANLRLLCDGDGLMPSIRGIELQKDLFQNVKSRFDEL